MKSGEIDASTTQTPDTLGQFTNNANYTVSKGDSTSWMTLAYNNANPMLSKLNVRQAITEAIDKKGLIAALGGNKIAVGSMVVPSDPWYENLNSINAYDPSAAKAKLKGIAAKDLHFTLTVANTYDSRIAEYVAAQLKNVGITVKINTIEFASWLSSVYKNKQYDLTLVLHVSPRTLSYYGNPKYYWNYNNPEAQQLATQASQAANFNERNAKMKQLASLVANDAVSDWLYVQQSVVVSRKGISGIPSSRIESRFNVSGITSNK